MADENLDENLRAELNIGQFLKDQFEDFDTTSLIPGNFEYSLLQGAKENWFQIREKLFF